MPDKAKSSDLRSNQSKTPQPQADPPTNPKKVLTLSEKWYLLSNENGEHPDPLIDALERQPPDFRIAGVAKHGQRRRGDAWTNSVWPGYSRGAESNPGRFSKAIFSRFMALCFIGISFMIFDFKLGQILVCLMLISILAHLSAKQKSDRLA